MAADLLHPRRLTSVVGMIACALLLALHAVATPTIRTDIGLGGAVVDGRFTAARIVLAGLPAAVAGRLVVEQQVGNAWKGSATVRLDVQSGTFDNGPLDVALPLHDALNPLTFYLFDSAGALLASSEVDLRTQRRLEPFPVMCATAVIPAEDGIVSVSPADLGDDWWSYDPVSRLWLAAAPSQDALRAIGQWVLAGGSLVLLTGEDFFRLDTPRMRELLPISDPQLITDGQGTLRLTGRLKPSAFEILSHMSLPLAYSWPYGAGHVTAVTLASTALDAVDFEALLPHLDDAAILTLEDSTTALLQDTPVSHPSHLIAVLLVVGGMLWFSVAVRVSRYRRKPAIGWVLLGIACFSVLSGLTSHRGNQYTVAYSLDTTLSVQTLFDLDLYCWATLGFDGGDRRFLDPFPGLPLLRVPESLHGLQFDVASSEYEIHLTLQPNEMRTLRTYGASSWPLCLSAEGTGVSIENHGAALGNRVAALIRHGRIYPIDPIASGAHYYQLRQAHDPETYSGPFEEIIRAIDAQFSFLARDWVLAIDEREELVDHDALTEKVRHLEIRLIGGDVLDVDS